MWRFLRSAPKYAVAAALFIVPTVLFALWWYMRPPPARPGLPPPPPVDNSERVAKVKLNHGRLVLADNDLYDAESGELLFKDWLKEGRPGKLFWEPKSETVLAQYERGFVRYAPDGTEKARLLKKAPFGIADDYKWVVLAKEKDVWRADIDWEALAFRNERKLTAIEQFNEQYFAANIFLGTEKTLVVRNLNKLLRVNLETGDVKPTQISLLGIAKRKSPDSKSVVGLEKGQFYCYDVDSEETRTVPVGRGAINDYQWLGNDQCAAIAAGKSIILYDRLKNTLTEIAALPFPCQRIGEPSPDGRFAFCTGNGKGVLVDLKKKTASTVAGGAGVAWVSNDTFASSREVPDSGLRGIWLQTAGGGERRISREPYLVGRTGAEMMTLPSAGLVVFATKHGLSKMKPDGSELAEIVKLAHSPERVLGIQDWKAN